MQKRPALLLALFPHKGLVAVNLLGLDITFPNAIPEHLHDLGLLILLKDVVQRFHESRRFALECCLTYNISICRPDNLSTRA